MTDIAVTRTEYTSENRSWLAGPHGTEPGAMPSATLDAALFSDAKFADVIKSGCVLGQVTATKKYGPYDPAASDGRETAAGLLFNTVKKGVPGNAALVHGFVIGSKLPYASGVGSLDADAKTDLRLIHVY